MKTKEEIFKDILTQMYTTYTKKNSDYSVNGVSSFEAGFQTFGLMSLAQRVADKSHRLTAYAIKGDLQVKDEGVKDTILDNAIYSVLGLVELEYQKRSVKES